MREQGFNSVQFEQSIGQILNTIKSSLSELADSVKDRVSHHQTAAEVLPSSNMSALIRKTNVMLDECRKSQDRRIELKKKIEVAHKEVSDINLRSPSKAGAAKEKFEKQLKSKLDINSTEMNMLMNQFSLFFRECLDGARHYQTVVNGMVLASFDKLAHVYKDWSSRTSSQVFPRASELANGLSILDVKLEGIPTSWVQSPPQESSFDQLVQTMEAKRMHSASTYLAEDIERSLARHSDALGPADRAKVDIYVLHLFSPRLTEAEETSLDVEIGLKLDQDHFVSYFLLTLNLQLVVLGKQNHKVSKRTFIGLKNKFLLMLSSRLGLLKRHRGWRSTHEQRGSAYLQCS